MPIYLIEYQSRQVFKKGVSERNNPPHKHTQGEFPFSNTVLSDFILLDIRAFRIRIANSYRTIREPSKLNPCDLDLNPGLDLDFILVLSWSYLEFTLVLKYRLPQIRFKQSIIAQPIPFFFRSRL
jgi:hypothetical protein